MIADALRGTSVTAVLIGPRIAFSRWVSHEIHASIDRGNGLFGVYIEGVPEASGRTSRRGRPPAKLLAVKAPCYVYDRRRFGDWVEQAAIRAGRPEMKKQGSWWF